MLRCPLPTGSWLGGEVEDVGAELFYVVQGLADLLIRGGGDAVEPLRHQGENLLLRTVRLLHFDDVADDILGVLHVHLQELDGLTLGFDFFEHFLINNVLQVGRPIVVSLLLARGNDHTIEEDLNDYKQILMSEKHQVLQA